MNEREARAACKKEGVALSDSFLDIVDAIFAHLPEHMNIDEANVLAGDLASRIAE